MAKSPSEDIAFAAKRSEREVIINYIYVSKHNRLRRWENGLNVRRGLVNGIDFDFEYFSSIFSIIHLRSLLAVADCLLFPVAGILFSLGAIGEKLIIR